MPINVFDQLREALPHGSGIDAEWQFDTASRGTIRAFNSYHLMVDGYYKAWADFYVTIEINEDGDLEPTNLHFQGRFAQYLNQYHQLRDDLEQPIWNALGA